LLRMVVGYHFFHEGAKKIHSGNFDSGPFMHQAKGPLAGYYHRMLDDHDGHWRLCIRDQDKYGNAVDPEIDTEITYAIWEDFVGEAKSRYRFNDPLLLDVLRKNLELETSVETNTMAKVKRVNSQNERVQEILRDHKLQLDTLLNVHRVEILAFAKSEQRLGGFQSDGKNREAVTENVASLREQVTSIATDRHVFFPAANWYASIEAIWDSFESRINDLPIDEQRLERPLEIHRPYDLKYSMRKMVNTVIPWFDTIVGGLLLIGLLTRIASIAAVTFLGSVVMSQPFWIHGTSDTWLQWIEIFALLAIFATCAGRYGGLDYFLNRVLGKPPEALDLERPERPPTE